MTLARFLCDRLPLLLLYSGSSALVLLVSVVRFALSRGGPDSIRDCIHGDFASFRRVPVSRL